MQLHLAPMKNFTCWAFRASMPSVTDSYTEMVNLKDLLKNKIQAWNTIDTYFISTQRQWIQILTHNEKEIRLLPGRLKRFSDEFKDKSFVYGVNINVGCPDQGVIAAGDGAALIKRTKRLIELINAFLGKPDSHYFCVSIKIRLGLNGEEMRQKKVLDILESIRSLDDSRIAPLIIHFKHAREPSLGEPHWEYLEEIIDMNVPIIINGNINSPEYLNTIKEKLSENHKKSWEKSISGIMIGRGALKNPNCFTKFNLINKNNEKSPWGKIFQQNLKIHAPSDRYISNFYKLYPKIFKN